MKPENSSNRTGGAVRGIFSAAALLSVVLTACGTTAVPGSEASIRDAATQSNVTSLSVTARSDGGLNVTGLLSPDGVSRVPFAARFPANWNGASVLEAHGYVTPGMAEAVPDPAKDPSFGLLTAAYAQGYVAANTAYAKTGYAVKEGVAANKALHDFLASAGAKRQYITGISMGGNITVALAEKYPNDYVGALPYCGVVAGWRAEERFLLDFRVVYDYYTKNTPYALPGNGDALTPNAALTVPVVQATVIKLFTAAAQGDLTAKDIIRQIVAVTGAPDAPVSVVGFITPLASTVYGLQDYLATTGGTGYSNTTKVYSGSGSVATDADLNAGVQRFTASTASAAYLDANYTPTGKFTAKMLSFHNTSDPLVPYAFEPEWKGIVTAAGNSANLVQQTVKPKPIDNTSTTGPAHCYFSNAEVVGAWNDLRNWVENGVKPADGKDITNK